MWCKLPRYIAGFAVYIALYVTVPSPVESAKPLIQARTFVLVPALWLCARRPNQNAFCLFQFQRTCAQSRCKKHLLFRCPYTGQEQSHHAELLQDQDTKPLASQAFVSGVLGPSTRLAEKRHACSKPHDRPSSMQFRHRLKMNQSLRRTASTKLMKSRPEGAGRSGCYPKGQPYQMAAKVRGQTVRRREVSFLHGVSLDQLSRFRSCRVLLSRPMPCRRGGQKSRHQQQAAAAALRGNPRAKVQRFLSLLFRSCVLSCVV